MSDTKIKIWHYFGRSRESLLREREKLEKAIESRAGQISTAIGEQGFSAQYDHSLDTERLAAVNAALTDLDERGVQ